jgi:hypothetical protein
MHRRSIIPLRPSLAEAAACVIFTRCG